jgi:glycosyltransferase involved in cell wall biosynthesis
MKISIITVVYNSSATIKDAIQSVLSQTYGNIEYIIVDGASTDGTVDIVRSYGNKIAKFVSEPDKGIYDAMNKGIAMATGDVVGILNSDDFYANDRVIEQVMQVMSQPGTDCCYADLVYVDRENTDKVVRYWKSCDYRPFLFERGWMPAHPTFFVRRCVYQKYGVFDLNVSIGTDHELLFRFLYKHRIKSVYIPQVLVKMRTGGFSNNSLKNVVRQNQAIIQTLKKNGVKVSPLLFLYKVIDRFRQVFSRPSALL